jgi:plasmid maintenance system killer protein
MGLSEGDVICFVAGLLCLSFVFINLFKLDTPPPKQPATPTVAPSAPPTESPQPPVDIERQREILGAQLEALHRDEWCRKFEEDEIKRYQQQKGFQYLVQRRMGMLEDAKVHLEDLRINRMELQRMLLLQRQYTNAARWNEPLAEGPYVEVLDDGSSIEYPE